MKASESLLQLLDALGYKVCGTVQGGEFNEYVPVEGVVKEQLLAEIDKRLIVSPHFNQVKR